MKKKFLMGALSCLFAFVGVFMVACGDKEATKVESFEVNGITMSYKADESVDFSNVTLDVVYDNEKSETLTVKEIDVALSDVQEDTQFVINTDGLSSQPAGNLTVGEYDITATIVAFDQTISLGTVTIESLWSQYSVVEFSAPEFISSYNNNATITDSEDSFYNSDELYTVGDDNPFKFRPTLSVFDEETGSLLDPNTYITLDEYNLDVNVYLIRGGETILADQTYYSYSNFAFDFTEKAIGERVRVELSLTDYNKDAFGRDISPIEFTFKVEDGWNVYDALDLGRMNLVQDGFTATGYARAQSQNIFYDSESQSYVRVFYPTLWKEFLEENGRTDLQPVKALFLHNDIAITTDSLPEEFFVTEVAQDHYAYGSLRDFALIYGHYLQDDDFTINGNYYQIDSSALPLGKSDGNSDSLKIFESSNNAIAGHSTLFNFYGKLDNTTTARGHIKNLNTIGNSGDYFGGDAIANGGALIFVKSMHSTLEVDNCIAKQYLIAWYGEQSVAEVQEGVGNLYIDQVKTYDCFNSAIFAYASGENQITNSELKRFGGPAIFLISLADANNTDIVPSSFDVDDNTVIESYVAGDEAWFVLVGANNIAPIIPSLDGALVYSNNTIMQNIQSGEETTAKFNLISVSLDNGYLTSNEKVYTELLIGEESENNIVFDTVKHQQTPYIVLETNTGKSVGLIPNGQSFTPTDATALATLGGDYLMLVLPQGQTQIGVVLELYQTQQSA